ncbi:hypothetical protein A2U01_0101407, partial [Trifolium medium]|nr:hypothetical protein [Trifolium medium]
PHEATADYLPWYYMVSHPRLFRPVDGPHGAPQVPRYVPVPAQQDDLIEEDAPPAEAAQGDQSVRHSCFKYF